MKHGNITGFKYAINTGYVPIIHATSV